MTEEREPGGATPYAPPGAPLSSLPVHAAAPGISPVAAVVGTFTAPGKTFEQLVAKPTWWLPLVAAILVTFVATLLIAPKIDIEATMREMFQSIADKTNSEVSEEQIQQALARQGAPSAVRSAAQAAVSAPLAFFFIALLLWGGSRIMGSESRYPQLLAIWGHSNLAFLVGSVLTMPLFFSVPDASLTQRQALRFVKSNLGAMLPDSTPAALLSIAGSIDVFALATLALLVVGMRKLPEISPASATSVPLALWVLWVAGKAAFAALFFG